MATMANQNGRHMVQHVLLPVNIHFHWNLFIFEFLTVFKIFILAAILKILKRAQLWVMIYLCVKFQKDPLYGLNLTFFAPWLPWQRLPFWMFSTPKSCHTLRWIFLQSFMKFDERNPKIVLMPLFCFYGNCGKMCPTDSDFFLAYLVPLDVDVVPNNFIIFCSAMIIFVFFSFLVFWPFPWQRRPFWKFQK